MKVHTAASSVTAAACDADVAPTCCSIAGHNRECARCVACRTSDHCHIAAAHGRVARQYGHCVDA